MDYLKNISYRQLSVLSVTALFFISICEFLWVDENRVCAKPIFEQLWGSFMTLACTEHMNVIYGAWWHTYLRS